MRRILAAIAAAALAGGACGGDDDGVVAADAAHGADAGAAGEPDAAPGPASGLERDLLSTDLVVDVTTREATATIEVAPAEEASEVAFEVAADLAVSAVTGPGGGALDYQVADGLMNVTLPAGADSVTVAYVFPEHDSFDGWMPGLGVTFIWPYYCGALFPCHSAPADGLRFTLDVQGVPEGDVAVFPPAIPADAPSYQIAFAVGDYLHQELGTTAAGTHVSVWYLSGGQANAEMGTARLVDVFDFYEQTYGAYSFGDQVGSVSARWGLGAFGGMEHHPMWHVATVAMRDELTHAHEAAHGWYGDGVRIACWEDFLLSEGTVNYLSARAMGAVGGDELEQATYAGFSEELDQIIADGGDDIAWPEGCNQIDVLDHFSNVPYDKGALFYRAVAQEVGADVLDGVLRSFYEAHVGGAAGMQEMLDAIEAQTGFDPGELAEGWLRGLGRPD